MKNAILENIKAAQAKKAAEKAAEKAQKAEAADEAAVEAFADAHKDVDVATIKDIIDAARAGKLFFIEMGYGHLVADYATSKKDAEAHVEWIYKSARTNKEEKLLNSSSIMSGMADMQRKFQIAHDALEAGLIPEDSIIDENNVEHWIVGGRAYSVNGTEEANLDDLETKLSRSDKKTLLKERIKKYQEELEKLEAEGDGDENENIDDEEDDNERYLRWLASNPFADGEKEEEETDEFVPQKKTQNECVDTIKHLMRLSFDEEVVLNKDNRAEYRNQRDRFEASLKSNGFCLLETNPIGLNESRYEICFFEQDESGFKEKKVVCYVRYVTGVFFGRIIQLTDELGAELDCIGRIG